MQNPEEEVVAVFEVEEPEPEEEDKTICARLVLTKEQLLIMEHNNLSLSVTADVTVTEEKIKLDDGDPEPSDVKARLALTREQEEDLRQAFNFLDHDGEGKIKSDDFRVAVKALGYEPSKEELQNMITAVDKGQSGKMSFENFETAIMRKIMSLDSDVDIMKSFRLFDMDDEGQISFENVKRVTEILGTYLTDEEIEEMIDDADKDMDGFINVQEFMRMIKTAVPIVTL